jgi:hypothetical protein
VGRRVAGGENAKANAYVRVRDRQSLPDYPPVTSADQQRKQKTSGLQEKALADEFISRKRRHVKNIAQASGSQQDKSLASALPQRWQT